MAHVTGDGGGGGDRGIGSTPEAVFARLMALTSEGVVLPPRVVETLALASLGFSDAELQFAQDVSRRTTRDYVQAAVARTPLVSRRDGFRLVLDSSGVPFAKVLEPYLNADTLPRALAILDSRKGAPDPYG